MKTTRRACLSVGIAAIGALALDGCRSLEQQATSGEIELPSFVEAPRAEYRMLNRAAFGPSAHDPAEIHSLGITGWIDAQLRPESIVESPLLGIRLRSLRDVTDADAGLLFDVDDHACVRALCQATLLRAVYSRRQVYERMAHFWTDHFNIYAYKNNGPQYKVIDDRETIRPHVLGRFRDLLGATARSAAMLGYLDNASNRKGLPNENYARELMELHTLGVNGGYTQRDVREVARCFTGWTYAAHWHRGQFVFDAGAHDDGAKTVLGHVLPAGGGLRDGEMVLDILAGNPATANHISRHLCAYFVGGTAPAALRQRIAAVFQRSGGDIGATVRALLLSPEVSSAPPMLKRPVDFAVSALRSLGADTDGGVELQNHLAAMGQPLFEWPMPDGFPQKASAWATGLIPRWRFAMALASGAIDATSVPWDSIAESAGRGHVLPDVAAVEMLFGTDQGLGALPAVLRESGRGDLRTAAVIALMSPQFQFR